MAEEQVQIKEEAEDAAGTPPAAGEAKRPARGSKANPVLFRDIAEIYPESPLPLYDAGPVKAYDAEGKGALAGGMIAYVCERGVTPRLRAIPAYKSIINPGLVTLLANGTVYWPHAGQERYVLLYNRNLGNPLLRPGKPPALDWKQDKVIESVLKPLTNVFQDMRDKDFTHGAINPANMFDGGSAEFERVILGDCLATPPGYRQSVLYEPITRAMADPAGRGRGTLADDLYALGVSVAVLMRARDPMAGLTDAEIIQQKMEIGSYTAVTGKDRFTGSVLELLRGLLNDDPAQRWNLDEVIAWLDGRRLSPKQGVKQKKAARPLPLGGERYFLPQLLAMDLEKHAVEAVHVIEDGALEQWLTRSIEDKETVERLPQVIQNARESGRGPGYQERLLSGVSALLDPRAPIRYRGMKLLGDGVGLALADLLVRGEDTRGISELLTQGVALSWAIAQEGISTDSGTLISQFDACRSIMRQNKIGYGIERCLYYLNPEVPCLSERLSRYHVLSPEDMMTAFEDLCQKGEASAFFLDRHSAAFLSVKERKVIDSYLFDLNSEEEFRRILANLKCLATIQKRSNLGSFPGIAKAFLKGLPTVYERYHDQTIREKLSTNIERYAAAGDLVKIAGLLDNADILNKDMAAFKSAMQEYVSLSQEYKKLDLKLAERKTFGKSTGQDVSAVVSCALSGIIILGIAFMYLTNQPLF